MDLFFVFVRYSKVYNFSWKISGGLFNVSTGWYLSLSIARSRCLFASSSHSRLCINGEIALCAVLARQVRRAKYTSGRMLVARGWIAKVSKSGNTERQRSVSLRLSQQQHHHQQKHQHQGGSALPCLYSLTFAPEKTLTQSRPR